MSANTRALNCPHCGAPLENFGDAPTMRCPFCQTVVVIPSDLRGASTTARDKREPPEMAEVRRLLQAGDKIGAIKAYRRIYPVGLAEAKEAVERMQAGLPVEPRAAPSSSALRVDRKKWRPLATLLVVVVAAMLVAVLFQIGYNSGGQISLAASPTPSATGTPLPTWTPPATPTPGFARVALAFGGVGTGAGLFNNARHLAVDARGNLYVADDTGGRIQVFDSTGKYLNQWRASDSKTQIADLKVDKDGTAYVIANEQIRRFNGETGTALGPVSYPPGDRFGALAIAPDGGLIAMWYENRWGVITSLAGHREDLVQFDRAGAVKQVWSSPISGQTGTAEIETQLAVDVQGHVLALGGTFDQAVFEFSSAGKFITRLISSGQGQDRLDGPGTLALDSQRRIYIGDSKGIKVFDRAGTFVANIPDITSPDSLAIDPNDDLWVLDSNKVTQFTVSAK